MQTCQFQNLPLANFAGTFRRKTANEPTLLSKEKSLFESSISPTNTTKWDFELRIEYLLNFLINIQNVISIYISVMILLRRGWHDTAK